MPCARSSQPQYSASTKPTSAVCWLSFSCRRCREPGFFFVARTIRPTRVFVTWCRWAFVARSKVPTISACAIDLTSEAESSQSFFVRRLNWCCRQPVSCSKSCRRWARPSLMPASMNAYRSSGQTFAASSLATFPAHYSSCSKRVLVSTQLARTCAAMLTNVASSSSPSLRSSTLVPCGGASKASASKCSSTS